MTNRTAPQTAKNCPHPEEFKPLSPKRNANPFPLLEWALAEAPIFYLDDCDAWFVTRFDDVRAVLRDPVTYSSKAQHRVSVPNPKTLAQGLPDDYAFSMSAG